MAGGSSDAAAALRLISQVSGLPIPKELPMRLGADVTVMLGGERALMTGAGEHVEPLPGEKPPLIVVPLEAELSAAQVYREFDARDRPRTPDELEAAAQALRSGTFEHVNDLEPAARRLCPLIDPALEALREAGAQHAMVSGSGPTVFGIGGDLELAASPLPAARWRHEVDLAGRRGRARGLADRPPAQAGALVPDRRAGGDRRRRADRRRHHQAAELREAARPTPARRWASGPTSPSGRWPSSRRARSWASSRRARPR